MRISELLYPTEYTSEHDAQSLECTRIVTHVNEIEKDSLFLHLPGVKYDTERLLPLVFAKHPRVIVTEKKGLAAPEDIHILTVPSARVAHAYMYARLCGLENGTPRLIAVTGTNGKTSTATMIEQALLENGYRTGFIGTGSIRIGGIETAERYYSMTTPDVELLYPTIARMRDAGCEYIVMEVSSHALALDKLAPLRFSIGVFTNLSEEHLDFHKDMEQYYLAKKKLFSMCELALLNVDDPYARRLYEEISCAKITVGALQDADVTAGCIENLGLCGLRYVYKKGGLTCLFNLSLVGIHNVYNSALALTAANAVGGLPCLSRRGIERLTKIPGRMETIAHSPTVILDYAHTERSLETSLKTINTSKKVGQKVIVVFGCGGERDIEKRPRMARVAEKYADSCIVTSDNPRGEAVGKILREILSGFTDRTRVRVIGNRRQAIEHAILSAKEEDIVYIGGKGRERYLIDKEGYHDFDEEKIVTDVLKKRKSGYT